MKRPNIVFFFTDDQRFDTIRALGNKAIKTPNMDKLVENGTTFTHCHIPGGTSGAVCMPSRAMLHTGRTLFHLEGEGQSIPKDHITMGQCLKESGYETFGTGKWHNGTESYARSFTSGGEIFFGGMWDHWNVPANDFDPTGEYKNSIYATMDPFSTNKTLELPCDHIKPGKHSSELFSDLATNYINNYKSDKPFFMYISFMAPHDPRTMPKKYMDMYNPDDVEIPENFKEEHPFNYGQKIERDEMLAAYPRTKKEIQKHIAEYYGMISHVDNEIGKVLNALKDNGYGEDTIIVFAGDNGLALGQHGLMGKQNLYEHSIRVPLIFSGAGIPKGKRTDSFAYLLDIFPTLCDLVSIEKPESVDGKSLLPVIEDDKSVREYLYLAFTDKIRGVKNHEYKLIEYRTQNIKKTQLFNIKNDLYETNDLSEDAGYKEVIDSLRNQLFSFRDEWDDTSHRFGFKFWNRY